MFRDSNICICIYQYIYIYIIFLKYIYLYIYMYIWWHSPVKFNKAFIWITDTGTFPVSFLGLFLGIFFFRQFWGEIEISICHDSGRSLRLDEQMVSDLVRIRFFFWFKIPPWKKERHGCHFEKNLGDLCGSEGMIDLKDPGFVNLLQVTHWPIVTRTSNDAIKSWNLNVDIKKVRSHPFLRWMWILDGCIDFSRGGTL